MENTIRVLVMHPNTNKTEEMRIPNTAKGIQSVIGGYFEVVGHPELGEVIILCDEDGRSKGLDSNIWFDGYYILGTVIFTVSDGSGEFVDLTDEHIKTIETFLWD